MKSKIDFITNSSSSSFILLKKGLTELQLDVVRNYEQIAKELDLPYNTSTWRVDEYEDRFELDTSMDNFDMFKFLKMYKIDIDNNVIKQWHS